MRYNIRDSWIDRKKYQILIGERNDLDLLVAYLSSRLPKDHRMRFMGLVRETFSIDMDEKLKLANGLLKMFENARPDFNLGSGGDES